MDSNCTGIVEKCFQPNQVRDFGDSYANSLDDTFKRQGRTLNPRQDDLLVLSSDSLAPRELPHVTFSHSDLNPPFCLQA